MPEESNPLKNDIVLWEELDKSDPLANLPPPGKQEPATSPVVIADVSIAPYKLAGRFRSSVGQNRRMGTAQIIGRGDLLITAAHCVRDKDGTWLSEFAFEPLSGPFAGSTITSAKRIGTQASFVSAPKHWNWPADYAFIQLNESISDEFLVPVFDSIAKSGAALGFPLDFHAGDAMVTFEGEINVVPGFPGQLEGEILGSISANDARFGLGASGGGWFETEEDGSVSNRLVGLTATTFNGGIHYNGPILGSRAQSLYEEMLAD